MKKSENKVDILCYFLKEFNKEIASISKVWDRENLKPHIWDRYQRLLVQIDELLADSTAFDIALVEKEVNAFRKKHGALIDYLRGEKKTKKGKRNYFEDLHYSVELLIQKLT